MSNVSVVTFSLWTSWTFCQPWLCNVISFLLPNNCVALYVLAPLLFLWVFLMHKILVLYHSQTLSFFGGNPPMAPESRPRDSHSVLVLKVQVFLSSTLCFCPDFPSTSPTHSIPTEMAPNYKSLYVCPPCHAHWIGLLPTTAFINFTTQSLKNLSCQYHEEILHMSLADLLQGLFWGKYWELGYICTLETLNRTSEM